MKMKKNASFLIIISIFIVLFIPTVSAMEDWEKAEEIVKNLPCSKGGTVDQYLTKKAEIPAVEDLGWITSPYENGFNVERLLLLNQTMPLAYEWDVDTSGKAKPINGKALEITRKK